MRSKIGIKGWLAVSFWVLSLIAPPIILDLDFRDYFIIWFLIVMGIYGILMPQNKTTVRGRFCIVIQVYSAIAAMAFGAWIGISVLKVNPLLSIIMALAFMLGVSYFLFWLYKIIGVKEYEMSYFK